MKELYEVLSKDFEKMRLREEIPEESFISDSYFAHESIINWCVEKLQSKTLMELTSEIFTREHFFGLGMTKHTERECADMCNDVLKKHFDKKSNHE